MAKKAEAVAIKPKKKRVARVSDADKIEALGELVGQLWMRIGHLENWSKDLAERDKITAETYATDRAQYQKDYEQWVVKNKRVDEFNAKLDRSFTSRIKWLFTGRV